MINTRLDGSKPTPIWATLGAPLLGIPLLVALLSVLAPAPQEGEAWAPLDDIPAALTTEVAVETVSLEVDDAVECEEDAGGVGPREG